MISAGSAVCFSAMTASHVTFRVICKSHQPPLGSITEMRGMTQLGLFADPQAGPAGLRYADDFVEAAVEQALIGRIAALPLQRFQFGAFEGNRRVASFGYRYDYTEQRLAEAEPIPDWVVPVTRHVEAWAGLAGGSVRQVLCTEYDAGGGIGCHRDKPHFDKILGLSLGSSCKFRFRRRSGDKWERHTLVAQQRSLYMIDGEARSQWEHSIPPFEERRDYSTFRIMTQALPADKTKKRENIPM